MFFFSFSEVCSRVTECASGEIQISIYRCEVLCCLSGPILWSFLIPPKSSPPCISTKTPRVKHLSLLKEPKVFHTSVLLD